MTNKKIENIVLETQFVICKKNEDVLKEFILGVFRSVAESNIRNYYNSRDRCYTLAATCYRNLLHP